MSRFSFLYWDILFLIKFFFLFIFFFFIFFILFYFFLKINFFSYFSFNVNSYFRVCIFHATCFLCFFFFIISLFIIFFWNRFFIDFNNLDVVGLHIYCDQFCIDLYGKVFSLYFGKFSLVIGMLFSILFPIICSLSNADFDDDFLYFYLIMFFISELSFLILLVNNIILFYIIYETILILVFLNMYLTSTSRGGIEASIFFAGWALLGSILVGLGIMLLVVLTNNYLFSNLLVNKLTANEVYYIYFLFFFGFGTKLSTWPFWYWLPRAHVEVSTSMSIFLSCILIKLSYFCLVRIRFILPSEISLNIFILVTLLCAIDIVFRLMSQKDLKAILAFSSVLHTNLFLALVHLDALKFLPMSILYIWGHSLATACLFICINMIELRFGSRSIIYVSGLWLINPKLALLTFLSLLSFLDFPCTMFFWGEFWLWNVLFFNFPFLTIQIMIICLILFSCIFFKIWWGIFFGSPTFALNNFQDIDYLENYLILFWLLFLQFIVGLQPSILTFGVSFVIIFAMRGSLGLFVFCR